MKARAFGLVLGAAILSTSTPAIAIPWPHDPHALLSVPPDLQAAAATIDLTDAVATQTLCTGAQSATYTQNTITGWAGSIADTGSTPTPLDGTLNVTMIYLGQNVGGSPWIMKGTLSLVDPNGYPVFSGVKFAFPGQLNGGTVTGRGQIAPLLYGYYQLYANLTINAQVSTSATVSGSLGASTTAPMYAVEWNKVTCGTGKPPNIRSAAATLNAGLGHVALNASCPGQHQHVYRTHYGEQWSGNQVDAGSAPIPLSGHVFLEAGYLEDKVSHLAIMELFGEWSGSGYTYPIKMDLPAVTLSSFDEPVLGWGELVTRISTSSFNLYANMYVIRTTTGLSWATGDSVVAPQPLASREWNLGNCAQF